LPQAQYCRPQCAARGCPLESGRSPSVGWLWPPLLMLVELLLEPAVLRLGPLERGPVRGMAGAKQALQ